MGESSWSFEFVKATLVQIIAGVQDAKDAVAAMPAAKEGMKVGSTHAPAQLVEFDVSVTAAEKSDHKGSGGVQIAVLSIGGGVSKGKERTAVNHVRFSVPVHFGKVAIKSKVE
jgi:hypothetical protein